MVLFGFETERCDGSGGPVFVERNERRVRGGGVIATTTKDFALDTDADLQRGPPDVVHSRFEYDHVPLLDGSDEVYGVHGCGDYASMGVASSAHRGGNVDPRHDLPPKGRFSVVRVVGEDQLRHFDRAIGGRAGRHVRRVGRENSVDAQGVLPSRWGMDHGVPSVARNGAT